jgi:2',3'-cyclic-nucleotide 2'-phosphodiesterase (5'-nucleotidase family)
MIHLTIFHTNDMHGQLENMARLSHFARRLRHETEAQGYITLFWDAGDAADRKLKICSLTKGAAFAPLLNAMGYSLQAMGNDIALTYGPQAMKAIAQRALYPILAANLRNRDDSLIDGVKDQVQIALTNDLTLGVIGLTAQMSPQGEALYDIFGLQRSDTPSLTQQMVDQMRADGVCLVIVLSHQGLEDDRQLVENVSGIDLIIGGHSHTLILSGEKRNNVLITQAGEYAIALGRIDATLDPSTGRLIECRAQVLEVPPDEPPDQALLKAIATAEAEVTLLEKEPVGYLKESLDLDFFNECALGNVAADALRERMGADLALVASGQFQRGLPAGEIILRQLHETTFSTANPAVTVLTGKQILEALERGLDPALNSYSHHGLRGTPFGIPQVSGIQVWYSPESTDSRRVRHIRIGNEILLHDHLYRVAHTDAEIVPEAYIKPDDGQITSYEVPTILVEVLLDYLRQYSPLSRAAGSRWIRTD